MANETSLIAILRGLPDAIILSDGATDWNPDNLIDVLRDAPESITRDYVLGETADGRITITALNANGYLESIPAFVQRKANP